MESLAPDADQALAGRPVPAVSAPPRPVDPTHCQPASSPLPPAPLGSPSGPLGLTDTSGQESMWQGPSPAHSPGPVPTVPGAPAGIAEGPPGDWGEPLTTLHAVAPRHGFGSQLGLLGLPLVAAYPSALCQGPLALASPSCPPAQCQGLGRGPGPGYGASPAPLRPMSGAASMPGPTAHRAVLRHEPALDTGWSREVPAGYGPVPSHKGVARGPQPWVSLGTGDAWIL